MSFGKNLQRPILAFFCLPWSTVSWGHFSKARSRMELIRMGRVPFGKLLFTKPKEILWSSRWVQILPKKRCYFPIHNFFAIIFCIITMFTYHYYVWRPRWQWISFVYSKNLFQIGQPPFFQHTVASCKCFRKKSITS